MVGGVRRFMTRRLLQSIYRGELARLAALAVKDQPSEARTARV
jgi:hypothetical protein